jgi:hypothetical protein
MQVNQNLLLTQLPKLNSSPYLHREFMKMAEYFIAKQPLLQVLAKFIIVKV